MVRKKIQKRLLIADVDKQSVEGLKKILGTDHDLMITADKNETMKAASSHEPPALILLNDLPPAADKYKVLEALKSDKATKDIPVILISYRPGDQEVGKGFELGAADYIHRPFMAPVVKARVRTHIELKRCSDNFEKKVKQRVDDLHAEIKERRDVEDTYRALVEHARDGIAIIHDFVVKYANPAFCRMLGFSKDELIGAHLKKFISEEEFIKNTTRYSGRIKGLNLPRIYKSEVIHADGSTFDVELNVSVVPYGKSLAALVFIRDMREEDEWQYCI